MNTFERLQRVHAICGAEVPCNVSLIAFSRQPQGWQVGDMLFVCLWQDPDRPVPSDRMQALFDIELALSSIYPDKAVPELELLSRLHDLEERQSTALGL